MQNIDLLQVDGITWSYENITVSRTVTAKTYYESQGYYSEICDVMLDFIIDIG